MNKRYRLYVNGEWYMSSDSEAEINEWANKFWTRDADDYYGNFPDVVVYDTVERSGQFESERTYQKQNCYPYHFGCSGYLCDGCTNSAP